MFVFLEMARPKLLHKKGRGLVSLGKAIDLVEILLPPYKTKFPPSFIRAQIDNFHEFLLIYAIFCWIREVVRVNSNNIARHEFRFEGHEIGNFKEEYEYAKLTVTLIYLHPFSFALTLTFQRKRTM